jgi:hypothetical protein
VLVTTADRLRRHPFVVAGLVAVVVAVWVQWRVLGHMGTRVSSDPDMSLFVWSMGHAPRQIAHLRNPFLTDAIFATNGGANLAYNATAPALALLMTPVTLLAGAVAAVNVLAVVTPVLNTLAARRLLAVTTRATGVAPLIGALLIGFSPFVLMHLRGRFQLAFQAVVLLLLAELWVIGRQWISGRGVPLRRALAVGALAGLQLWIGTELLAIAATVALIVVAIAIVGAPRYWRHRLRRCDIAGVGAAIGVLIVVASPFLFAFVGGREPYPDSYHVTARPLFGLRIANTTTPTEVELLGSVPLSVDRGALGTFPDEDTGYLSVAGVVVIVLVASRWRRLDALRRGALVTLVVCWLLALGPSLRWSGAGSGGVPGPWRLVQALPFVQEIVANRMTFGVVLALGVLVAMCRADIGALPARSEGVLRAAALVCLPVLMVPAPNDHVRAASSAADDALRDECGGELVMTAPQGREQDGMAWQSRADFDFDLLRGFAFRESSEPKGPLTLLDTAAGGTAVDVAAAVAELNALGVGCVLAASDAAVVVRGVATVLGPPHVVGDVAIWAVSS